MVILSRRISNLAINPNSLLHTSVQLSFLLLQHFVCSELDTLRSPEDTVASECSFVVPDLEIQIIIDSGAFYRPTRKY